MAESFLSVTCANSPDMDCKMSGSTITVRSEFLEIREAKKIFINILTSLLILVISTVEQFSTFGSCHTAGFPSHNLEASPTVKS